MGMKMDWRLDFPCSSRMKTICCCLCFIPPCHHCFPLFPQLINETKIVIVPSINPDGREQAAERQCNSTQGLGNANGKDLDREFFG